ncbi:MAG: beta-ketoacyl-[acyl-carrier-protein] synthase family protein [Fibrobacteria bacterium]|nr:beta-ketoacyl-[acyl-carrier-protein] synthase family protein [Fibrobacteria bacterium]
MPVSDPGRTRVVVTGLGAVSPLGPDLVSTWEAVQSTRPCVEPIPEAWEAFWKPKSRFWAPLPKEWIQCPLLAPLEPKQLDPVSILALESARQACSGGAPAGRGGVFVGTGSGGGASRFENHLNHLFPQKEFLPGRRGGRFNPFCIAMGMPNSPAAMISIKLSIEGPCRTFSSSCASGTVAIGQAAQAIRSGEVEWAVAGGAEYLVDPDGTQFHGFDVASTLTRIPTREECNRPFDAGRSGFLFAAGGAAMLRLESERSARERGAAILATLDGVAENCDAYSPMAPAPTGERIQQCALEALADAGLLATDVDCINAHGTGTEANDRIEAAMLERVFGRGPKVTTTKALTGHLIGAGGALEAVFCVQGLLDQIVPGMPNLVDPIADLDFVLRTQASEHRNVLKLSFGFGGHNVALVFTKAGTP